MRSRWFKLWRRILVRLRAARVIRRSSTYTGVPGPVEVDPMPVYPDLSALDAAEISEWNRFIKMVESGNLRALMEGACISRFLAIKEKVKWIPAPQGGRGGTAGSE